MSELYIRLGNALKLERQNKNLSLPDLSVQLKTTETILQHIEDGDQAAFSSPVYFNLYAKSYAESIGVDYARTVDAIREDLGEVTEPQATAPAPAKTADNADSHQYARSHGGPGRALSPGAKVVLFTFAGIVLVGAGWYWKSRSSVAGVQPPVQKPAPQTTMATPPDNATAVGVTDSTALTLSLNARGSSWVSLMTDGDTALYRTFSAGETMEVSAQKQMIITVGTPSQIDLTLNGSKAHLTDRAGRISNVVVTPANIRAYIEPHALIPPAPVRVDSTGKSSAAETGN